MALERSSKQSLRHYVFIVQAVFYTDNSVCVLGMPG